jgi:2-polyprenyl-6-methoxyphenol hydroxylase-like FAD-dependent oxidoreductase
MAGIGIFGTGISGLQLALYLQAAGIETTIYSPQTAEELRAGRLPNLVFRWAPTIDRERELGLDVFPEHGVTAMHVAVAGDRPLAFRGRLPGPARSTDFRLYLPALLEHYEARGGRVVVAACTPADLDRLARGHDLVVVAAGRDGSGNLFPRHPDRSPHQRPARHITAGLYRGIAWPEPAGPAMVLIPGAGEIFHLAFHSFEGPVSALSIEAIPGGPLDGLSGQRHDEDLAGFEAALLGLLATFAPSIHRRVEPAAFGLTRPLDLLQGSLTPVVRRGWAPLGEATHAIAIGDAWILNDPIAAQGANLGSRCAFVLGEAIAAGGPYDEAFCRRAAARLWDAAAAPTALSNALLEPPTAAVIATLVRAAQDEAAADRFVSGFGDPEGMLALLAGEPAGCVR